MTTRLSGINSTLGVAVASLIRHHANFRRLWVGQTVSEVGTQIGNLAVPLIAVHTVDASTFQISALFAAEYAPYVLIGLPAGVWVDRLRRRRVLIVTDLIRAVALLAIPAAMVFRAVTLPLLYGVVFVVGAATVFFSVTYQAYLPAVVERDQLIEANGRLTASRSIASAAGPTAGGSIVAALTAPLAVAADAFSYLCSAALITAIRAPEPAPKATEQRNLRREMGEGLRLVRHDRLLWTMTLYSAASSLCVMMAISLELVFLVRAVHLGTVGIGLLLGISSFGAVLGAFAAAPLRRQFGELRTLVGAALASSTLLLLVPLTALGPRLAFFVLGTGGASCGIVAYNIIAISMQQRRCPGQLLGRMFATQRFVGWSTPPIGALAAGGLGSTIGLRATLLVAAVLYVVSTCGLGWSLRRGVPTDELSVAAVQRSPAPVAR